MTLTIFLNLQFDKSLADTMVKQVKNKTTLKVCLLSSYLSSLFTPFLRASRRTPHRHPSCHLPPINLSFDPPIVSPTLTNPAITTGSPQDLSLMRRRLDLHCQESHIQDGVKRDGQRATY